MVQGVMTRAMVETAALAVCRDKLDREDPAWADDLDRTRGQGAAPCLHSCVSCRNTARAAGMAFGLELER